MDTSLQQKFPFILDRNLAKANCPENQVCTSCDAVDVDTNKLIYILYYSFIFITKNFLGSAISELEEAIECVYHSIF